MIGELEQAATITLVESDLTSEIIAAAICVHRELGPGLLESAYQASLGHELSLRGIAFRSQVDLPVEYKGCPAGLRIPN